MEAREHLEERLRDPVPDRLGDVLYASGRKPLVPEGDWVALVRQVAGGDERALHALYDRAHHLVYTLAVRITCNGATAEEVTLDVFHDVWRRAAGYDAANGTVLGWIMNQARSRSIDRLRFDARKKRRDGPAAETVDADNHADAGAAPDPCDLAHLAQQGRALRAALAALAPDERLAIECAFLSGLTHVEVAARLNEPLGTIKTRIRSGLHKLRRALESAEGTP
ncbi:MAG TPA: sigma-70 family RNA polymerase sigma factor [Usitatibacter sp.]|jgi:RNA polymerase sigma-70 factor (ECF subfamily)|nr:sigma-70 family RNA polymerase sigma factor [Usitatibacter sp.]